jgi:hypothetical protein
MAGFELIGAVRMEDKKLCPICQSKLIVSIEFAFNGKIRNEARPYHGDVSMMRGPAELKELK